MPFKLTKTELAELSQHGDKLREQRVSLDAAVESYNAMLSDEWDKVENAITDYNAALTDARSSIDELFNRHDGEFDDKQDSWKESERGQAAKDWIEAMELAVGSMEDISIDKPDTVNTGDIEDHAELVEGIQEEPNN